MKKQKKVNDSRLKEHYADSYGIFSGKAKYSAEIKINIKTAPWTVFEHWHSNQKITRLDESHILLHVPFNDDRELIADVMRLGHAAEVTQPKQLREKISNRLKRTLKVYE